MLAAVLALSIGARAEEVAQPAEFPGGNSAMIKWIAEHIQYPPIAVENLIEGTVVVSMTVDTDGKVRDAKIVRPVDPDLEKEALRVVSSFPAWTPARNLEGAAVPMTVNIPVSFRL